MSDIRPAAVAGTWYSGDGNKLAREVDEYLDAAAATPPIPNLVALIAPHAGLMYSGPVAAHAYRQLRGRGVETVILVGPSHFVAFEGVAVYPRGAFESPLGVAKIDEAFAHDLIAATSIVYENRSPHRREHSLEMQLPFVRRVAPQARIVPLLMGHQTDETARELGEALGRLSRRQSTVLIASSDLSHYENASTAHQLDGVVLEKVAKYDADGLQAVFAKNPHHACGGGPMVAVMRAAQALGATQSQVLHYADSGDVSGDKTAVVGYMAAALSRA